MAAERGEASRGKLRSADFERIYRRARKAVGPHLVLLHESRDAGFVWAVVASRKVGNAVRRNRAKRLLREAFRTHAGRPLKPGAYLLIARPGIPARKTPEIAAEIEKLLTRLECLLVSDASRRNHR